MYKNTLYHLFLLIALSGISGCSGSARYASIPPLQLTPADEARVGTVVEQKLIQLLGGPYHDQALGKDLSRQLQSNPPFTVTVADQSEAALYPLPGGRAIVSRGLLSSVSDQTELHALLARAVTLSSQVTLGRTTRSIAETTAELLASPGPVYDPNSAAIRLAHLYAEKSCNQDCLSSLRRGGIAPLKISTNPLPESIKRLAGLQPGYELLVSARGSEKAGKQSDAIATYLQAAAVTPDEPLLLGSLGLAYLRAGQLQSARLHLEKAVKLQPEYYRTHMGLGYLYLQSGKLRQAKQALTESVRLLPVTENLFLLAEVREKSDDVEGALSLYRLVVESDRDSKLGRTSAKRLAALTAAP